MSEVVARILRAAGEIERPSIQAVVLAKDAQGGAFLVDRLTELGVTAQLASNGQMVLDLLSGNPDYNGLVVDATVPHAEVEALAARANALRPATSSLAVIHLADGGVEGRKPQPSPPSNLILQSVALQDLGAALNAAGRSTALAAAEIQRQVEIIARAVIRLGQRLQAISHDGQDAPHPLQFDDVTEGQEAALDSAEAIASLRRLIRARRLRERFFEGARFGEPAWDILLDLSLAWFEGKAVSVSSVCIASGVPMTTAMRWINEMIDAGLIDRWIDPTDGRRNLVQIAPATRQAMVRYLLEIGRIDRSGPGARPEADQSASAPK